MSPAPERFFLDTNIFVYTFDSGSPAKRARAHELVSRATDTRHGVISFQVIQEFLSVATRKFAKPLRAPEAQLYLERILMPLCEVFPDASLYSQAIALREETQLSFYDSLIVSAAVAADCRILWTEDLQHKQRIRNLEIRNPFAQ
jgi:predicted nucleic acid-binding protein